MLCLICFLALLVQPYFREAQNCRVKITLIVFFAFPVLSGNFGKQSLRFRAAITFFYGITVLLYQNKIPVDDTIDRKQFLFCSLEYYSLLGTNVCKY
jgi:hypothetical protein